MSDYGCLGSPNHTYAKVEGVPHGYQCRSAAGRCEIGFVQAEDSAEQCETDSRCEYKTGSCYCPPGMQCICGGGSPGQCQSREQPVAQERLPIIDIHMHATGVSDFGGPISVCTNEGKILYPGLDPRDPITVERAAMCDSPLPSSRTDAELLDDTVEMLERYNIFAVADGTLQDLDRWRAASPERIIPAMNFNPFNDDGIELSPAGFRELFLDGKLQVFAEVGPQYQGRLASDDALDKYFALAEELDIPVGVHLGEGHARWCPCRRLFWL